MDAARAIVPEQPSTSDATIELRRLLRLTIIMFVLALFVAIVLGLQLKRTQLQISTLSTTTFSKLEHDATFTIFLSGLGSETRDGVHGALNVEVGNDTLVLGYHPAKWTFDAAAGTLRAEDGRFLVGYGHDGQNHLSTKVCVADKPTTSKISLFIEAWSNRLFVHSGGCWLVRAPFMARDGGRAHCVWTCATQSVPELFFGVWEAAQGNGRQKGQLNLPSL